MPAAPTAIVPDTSKTGAVPLLHAASTPPLRRRATPPQGTVAALCGAALLAALALLFAGPIGQWADYHAFADSRDWAGVVPNAADVLSNLAFAAVGGWGLWRLRGATTGSGATLAWRTFAAAVFCTALGSAAYHWAPGNGPLVFDRLPIAWACAAVACAFGAERLDRRWASPPSLAAALLAASASVGWWWLGERSGGGDLRPYLFVQFAPMLLIPVALALRVAPIDASTAVPARAWWTVLALYAAAKAAEGADHAVLDATGFVSGHTVKHLLAAAGAGVLLLAATAATATPLTNDSRR